MRNQFPEKFPEDIQVKITDEFLTTFKNELDNVFSKEKPNNATYWNFYQWFDSTQGFYIALEKACEIHKLRELYDYLEDIGSYFNDILAGSLTEMLYERHIVEEGSFEDAYPNPLEIELPDVKDNEAEVQSA